MEDPLEAPAQTRPPVSAEGSGAALEGWSFPVGSLATVRQCLRAEAYQEGLQSSSPKPFEDRPIQYTEGGSENLLAGVVEGVRIPLQPL